MAHRRIVQDDDLDLSPAGIESLLTLLREGEIVACQDLPWGSNYSFAIAIQHRDQPERLAIYKPRRGEAPLWDFPSGTLYRREQAAYLLSRRLTWPNIPPTTVRQGPHGIGSVQLYIPPNEKATFRQLRETHANDLRRLAVYDLITNNADRKAGHCLLDRHDRLWGIDHGLTFNGDPKLRTVIWDFSGEPIPAELIAQLEALCEAPLEQELRAELGAWLTRREVDRFYRRVEEIALTGVYPELGSYRNIPWGW
jgi:uncharacterized repeat protein (TIGR03843 family)